MLCYECEQAFSVWEGAARSELLGPSAVRKLPVKYGPWLQLFALSISWRALAYLKYATPSPYARLPDAAARLLPSLTETAQAVAHSKLDEWASDLLAKTSRPNRNDQHLIFLNGNNVPFERAAVLGFTVCEVGQLVCIVSQLGSMLVVGIIAEPRPLAWKGTRVQSLGGKFPVTTQTIPEDFATWLREYFANIHALE
jgi:hypothetical protein